MKLLIQALLKIQKTALEANPAFMKARAAYSPEPGELGPIKYADYERFLPGFISAMGKFGLLEEILGEKKLCVLDIGTGPGYTPHLFNLFGHEAYGLDIPYSDAPKIYKEFTTALGIKRIVHRIQPFEPLPCFKVAFDLVIARWTCFNTKVSDDGSLASWDVPEWDYFLKDLLQYCTPNVRLFFELNKARGKHTFLDFFPNKELLAYFLSRGAYIKGRFISFPCCDRIRKG
ncbi:class I SAM-dependent methyltransferase [Desulfovibrio sp. ZJ369]|uniref:class I SAM-dependent methyltransferase n=1 Tax=Desulfovibrio sp. ZJ369 TaxID=2709793 RepID=UPI0013EBD02C|nr:class I SAM-dependent methyltransferase [Desulfovibrio sp. ZJ369]